MNMKHLDLFSGIGGFSLALDQVVEAEHTFCDNDKFCQEVLKKNFPNTKIYDDIRSITNERADLVTGGFPCQPFSQAGKRRGTADDRYLWPEMFRVIQLAKPTWVIAENVGGLVTWNEGMVLEQVCSDLENKGYEVQSLVIPAVAKGAPHRRDRVWIIGYSEVARKATKREVFRERERDKKSAYTKRGNTANERNDSQSDTPDPQRKGYEGQINQAGSSAGYSWDDNWFEVAAELCRVDDGLPRRLDRNERLKSLGNAIVPQVAEEIIRGIYFSKP